MAVTNRLASTRLQSGEDTAEVALTPPGDGLVLRMTTTAVVSPCQARLTVRDSQGTNRGSLVCQNGEDKRLSLEGFPAGGLVFQVECNLGTVDVQLDELTDLDAVLPEGSGSGAPQLETDDIPAGGVTLPKVSFTGIKVLRFDGAAMAGAITLTGAAVGDRVVAIFGTVVTSGVSIVGGTDFQSVITVVDQIQQTAMSDLSGNDYVVLLAPATA